MSINHSEIPLHQHFYLGSHRCRSILLMENDGEALPCTADALALCGDNLKARVAELRQSAMGTLPFLLCISARLDNDAFADRLRDLMTLKPDGLILMDARDRSDGERLDAMLRVEEALAGLPDGQTQFLAILGLETQGFARAIALAQSSARLIAIGQDSRAIAMAIGAKTTDAAEPVLQTCRGHLQLAAASAKIPACEILVSEILGASSKPIEKQVETLVHQGFQTLITDDPHKIAVINAAFERASGP